MDQIKMPKLSPENDNFPKAQYPTTIGTANNRAPPLEGGYSKNICGMWDIKHEIRSPKLYEIIIKIELKGNTAMNLKNLYNHIKMGINAVNRL